MASSLKGRAIEHVLRRPTWASNRADATNRLPRYSLFAADSLLSTKTGPIANLSTTLVRHGKTSTEMPRRTERSLTSIQSAQQVSRYVRLCLVVSSSVAKGWVKGTSCDLKLRYGTGFGAQDAKGDPKPQMKKQGVWGAGRQRRSEAPNEKTRGLGRR
jgi:hypothetical protein